MEDLILDLKKQIIEVLNLKHLKPEDIIDDQPLFGEGLGLDSIDALELIVLLQQQYQIRLIDPQDFFRPNSQSLALARQVYTCHCMEGR